MTQQSTAWFESVEAYVDAHPSLDPHVEVARRRLGELFPRESRLELRLEPSVPGDGWREQVLFLTVWTSQPPDVVGRIFQQIDETWGVELAIATEGRVNLTYYHVHPSVHQQD